MIVKTQFAMEPVDQKVRIESCYIADAQTFTRRDDRCVCEIHWNVGVFRHQFNNSIKITGHVLDGEWFPFEPAKKIDGDVFAKVEKMRRFSNDRSRNETTNRSVGEIIDCSAVVGITGVKQRDQWSRIDGDAPSHE